MSDKAKQQKKKRIGGGENPFELKKNRTKFAVMGKKVKGTVVKTAKSNAEAQDRRKATIGAEFELRGKTGKFVDKRFGENDNMTEAEKSSMRFHQERLRQTQSMFSIEPEKYSLTHLGMRLGDDGAAPNTLQDDLFFKVGEDDEFGGGGGLVDEEAVRELHFGGGGDPNKPRKSKKEIMDEIVARSKMQKADRREENLEQMELMQKVDDQFKEITSFLTMKKKPKVAAAEGDEEEEGGAGGDAGKKGSGKKNKKKKGEKGGGEFKPRAREAGYVPDEYDLLVTELRAASRDAKAADRMQSKEEEAKQRLERLKALEVMRERRMNGVVVGEGEGEDDDKDEEKQKRLALEELKKRLLAGRRGNDEDADFLEDEGDYEDEDEEEGADGEGGNGESNRRKKRKLRRLAKHLKHRTDSQRADWVMERRWRRDLLDDDVQARMNEQASHQQVVDANTGEEIGFVLDVPDSMEDFAALMTGNSLSVCRVILERMLQSNDPLLAPANADKLHVLQGYIIGFCLRQDPAKEKEAYEWIDMAFNIIRRLVLMIPSAETSLLTQDGSIFFAYRVLLNAVTNVEPCIPPNTQHASRYAPLVPRPVVVGRRAARANASFGVPYVENGFPTLPVAMTLLELSCVFSASDRFHPVWSPTVTHLCGVLSSVAVTRSSHLVTGCFIATALAPVLKDGNRFAGEPLAFLVSAAQVLAGESGAETATTFHPHWKVELGKEDLSSLKKRVGYGLKVWASTLEEHSASISLLEAVVGVAKDLEEAAPAGKLASDRLSRIKSSLQYLQLRPEIVKPLKDIAPRLFLTEGLGYVGDKDIDPNVERREAKILQRKIKSEKRGAMRELKRDREYINTLKREEFAQETSERKESMKAITSFLQQGQAEKNKEKRSKLKL